MRKTRSTYILKVRVRKIEALIEIDRNLNSRIIECNLIGNRCYNCVPFCEVIVAAKDYVTKRRKPKGEVTEL
uniref:Uncharacterized protein n=1 Tax=Geoglobus ahangari TaxID=113653 RepID=A0A7C4S6V0_9EURY